MSIRAASDRLVLTNVARAAITSASNWVPEQRESSASASGSDIAGRYARSVVIALKASQAEQIRASIGIASPALAAKPTTPPTAPATAGCAAPVLTSALAGFGDWRSYFVAPGGDFESSADGWTLTGGARTASGSGPLRLGAAANSLRLPAGATATSPVFCVDLNYPTFRFFSTKGNASLNVDVIYPALGTKKPKATTVKGGATGWTLAKDVDLRPTVVTRDAGWRLVQLRFIAGTGATGDWLVDDVLIDPKMR